MSWEGERADYRQGHVAVYNGDSSNETDLMARFSARLPEQPIEGSASRMLVSFVTTGNKGLRSFEALYSQRYRQSAIILDDSLLLLLLLQFV